MSQSLSLELSSYTLAILFGEAKVQGPVLPDPKESESQPSGLLMPPILPEANLHKRRSDEASKEDEPATKRARPEEEDFLDYKHIHPSDIDPATGMRRDTPGDPEPKQPAGAAQKALMQNPLFWRIYDMQEALRGAASACSSASLRVSATSTESRSSDTVSVSSGVEASSRAPPPGVDWSGTASEPSSPSTASTQESIVPRTPSPPPALSQESVVPASPSSASSSDTESQSTQAYSQSE